MKGVPGAAGRMTHTILISTGILAVFLSGHCCTAQGLRCYNCDTSHTGCENNLQNSYLTTCQSSLGVTSCVKIAGTTDGSPILKRACISLPNVEDKCYTDKELQASAIASFIRQLGVTGAEEITACFCKDKEGCNGAPPTATRVGIIGIVIISLAAAAVAFRV